MAGPYTIKSYFRFTMMLFFNLLSTILVICSSMVILSNHPIYSLFYLIVCFFISACFLFLLNCEFLALIFITVYVGAIAVLFLFSIMMLDTKIKDLFKNSNWYFPVGFLFFVCFLFVLIVEINTTFPRLPKKLLLYFHGSYRSYGAEPLLSEFKKHSKYSYSYSQFIYTKRVNKYRDPWDYYPESYTYVQRLAVPGLVHRTIIDLQWAYSHIYNQDWTLNLYVLHDRDKKTWEEEGEKLLDVIDSKNRYFENGDSVALHPKRPFERLDRLGDTFSFLERFLQEKREFSIDDEWLHVKKSFMPTYHFLNTSFFFSWEDSFDNGFFYQFPHEWARARPWYVQLPLYQNIVRCKFVLNALEPAFDIEAYGTTLYTEYYLPFLMLGLLLLMILIAVVFLTKDYYGSSTIWNQIKFQQLARKSKVFKTSNLNND